MPPKPFRVARLSGRSVRPSTSPASTQATSHASQEKMRLLTYKMALAQPSATVPLLANAFSSQGRVQAAVTGAEGSARGAEHSLDVNRRWVRDADELCIASIRRSNNINKINTYVATYKFDDPHWRPFLLPEVHIVPAAAAAAPSTQQQAASADGAPPPHDAGATPLSSSLYDVHVNYDKLLNIELISRHANFALRHLVQKGHAMYFVNYSQHSIVEMRGLIEASYITCAYGIKGERLRTHLLHIGPLDVRDVMEMDPVTGRVTFNLKKKNVRKGVVAVSLVEGYGTWFQRKPMLWQRTRRIGALQSNMGAFDYQLCPSATVGKLHDYEVALLEPHVRMLGASGGAEAVGLIASSQVAQNDRLYLGQFEAPVIAALDAVHQLAHRVALHSRLLRPVEADPDPSKAPAQGQGPSNDEDTAAAAHRRQLAMERLLPVSWVTRTPPPYVPLEADLPFRLQLSRPAVFHTERRPGKEGATVVFPTGGTVGSPMVRGVPLSLYEYNLHQGVDHYIFDDAPSARPTKWWSQKSNMPYNGYMYCMRSGLLDYVVPAETFPNPLAPPSPAAYRRSSSLSQQWKRERRRRRELRRQRRAELKAAQQRDAQDQPEAHVDEDEEAVDGSAEAEQPILSTTERWEKGREALQDHDDEALAAEDALLQAEEQARYITQRRPALADIVPPSEKAAERAARYAGRLLANDGPSDGAGRSTTAEEAQGAKGTTQDERRHPSASPSALSPAEAVLQRQLRQRALKKGKGKLKRKKTAASRGTDAKV